MTARVVPLRCAGCGAEWEGEENIDRHIVEGPLRTEQTLVMDEWGNLVPVEVPVDPRYECGPVGPA